MTAIQSHHVQAGDLRLHFLEAGAGAPLLFLHGWPTNAQLWRHVLPAVAPFRRCIALDLPGFGDSDKPLDTNYGFRFFDEALTRFLSAIGVTRVGLVVHDLGGPVGLHWAAKNRARITELAILNTLVFPDLSWAVKAFVVAARLPGLGAALTSPWGIARAMRFGVRDKARITPEVAALYTAPFQEKAARRALLKAAYGLHPKGLSTIADALPDFTVPTRLLYGERDGILPDVARTMARVQAILPHAELSSIPDCGHFLQEDQPEAVAEALAGFFSAHDG